MKNYCHIWNQYSRYCQNAKFCAKIEILKFGIKNALFWYFGVKFWKTVAIFDIKLVKPKELCQNKNPYIWDQKSLTWVLSCYFKKLFLFLKSALSNFPINKVLCQKKKLQIWSQKFLIWLFWGCNFEKLLSHLESALSKLSK